MKVFPYLATPNTELQTVAGSVELPATADQVWSLIGAFGSDWHPLIARVRLTGTGIGQLRTLEMADGKVIVERLEALDDAQRFCRYTNVAGVPAAHYTGMLEVAPNGGGCIVTWRVQYLADGRPDIEVKRLVLALQKTGLESLQARFGVAQ
jgi:hypothetical protein